MSIPAKPVILIIHGGWHSPAYFQKAISQLQRLGYEVSCSQQPTTGGPPEKDLYDDVAVTRPEIERLVEQGRDVVVVMHSYGGMVGTQAASGLGRAERVKKGLKGGVTRLCYACAFMLPAGSALVTIMGGQLPPWIRCEPGGYCYPTDPPQNFYNELSPEDQKYWTSQLKKYTTISQEVPLTKAAWTEIPVSYLFCEKDQALPIWVQKMMVENSGIEVQEFTCDADHSPFLSRTEEFVSFIVKSAEIAA